MEEKILLSSNDRDIIERYLSCYRQQMEMAETRCWLSQPHLDEMKKLTELYRKLDRMCKEKGLDIHTISCAVPSTST